MLNGLSTALCVYNVHAVHSQLKGFWLSRSGDLSPFMLIWLDYDFERTWEVVEPCW